MVKCFFGEMCDEVGLFLLYNKVHFSEISHWKCPFQLFSSTTWKCEASRLFFTFRGDVHTLLRRKILIWFFRWVGRWIIFIMTFCEIKVFERRYGVFKRKNIIIKYKKLERRYVCFSFNHGSNVGGICTRRVFKFCLCNQSAENHFYSSQHVENWRKKNTSYVYTVSGTIY